MSVKHARIIEIAPVIVPAAYGAGDVIGSILTITDVAQFTSGVVKLKSVNTIDNNNAKKDLALYFFKSLVAPGNDNAALDLSAAESLEWVGTVDIADTEYVSTAGGTARAHATKGNIELLMKVSNQNKLYVVVVAREAVTYAAATDLKFILGFEGP